ncbi:hypothetical protein OGAPHI_005927 [Ogataea philodendri]|uniref:Kinesin motor domain-containing protein n=1 Tax=Ogataea philodendri TaxID=1378263 RepID=A0A9P8NYF3_9ASCO|nr:uncharacterized protein OGAPHI_005927 [Ogataea philodendri]KAH3661749.1 hypothetical protein OGAPHI_005927 [Ogataea philodendri]
MPQEKHKPTRKRQKYSRNGCLACKKRKVKCDEALPTCGRCAKINSECIYYRVFKFQSLNVSDKKAPSPVPEPTLESSPHEESSQSVTEGLSNLLEHQELLFGDIAGLPDYFKNDANPDELQLLLPDYGFPAPKTNNVSSSSRSHRASMEFLEEYQYLLNLSKSFNELDLNRIADSLDINYSESMHLQSFVKNVHLILFPLATSYMSSPFIVTFLEEAKKSNYLLNAMLASGARFLTEKARIDQETYLSTTSGKRDRTYLDSLESQIELNDKYRVHYLSNCFQSLKEILENMDDTTQKVEPALLTSLILAADLSSNKDYKWSLHLRGAKQFLSKFDGEQNLHSNSLILARYLFSSLEISSGMASTGGSSLDLEELATWIPIPLNHGPVPKLSQMGMVIDGHTKDSYSVGGFKMYMGYSDGVMEVAKEIVLAKRNKMVDPFTTAHIFSVIDKARDFYVVTNKKPYMIPVESRFHPLYEGADKAKLTLSGYYHLTNPKLREFVIGTNNPDLDEESYCWYSFFDFTQNLRLETLYMYVLTSGQFLGSKVDSAAVQRLLKVSLESCSFMVQLNYKELVDADLEKLEMLYNSPILVEEEDLKVEVNLESNTFCASTQDLEDFCSEYITTAPNLEFRKYLNFDLDHRISMIQWCTIMCGYCCIDATDKLIVDCLLNNLLSFGLKSAKIPVVVRIPGQNGANQVSVNTSQDITTSQVADTRVYTVDQSFGPAADQGVFFRDVGLPLVNEFLKGYNCTILAYGQTGSGKTYTMCGDISDKSASRDSGLVPRILCKLFEFPDAEFMVKCSFVEIYNEELKDLLADTKNQRLRIYDRKRSSGTEIHIEGLEEFHIKTAKEGLELLKQGLQRRQTAATKMNDLSSRSHTIFSINLLQKKNDSEYQFAKMNLVDLAGSENISRSGAINQRAKEAGSINQSLLTLGRVINALVDKNSYIPYRESKLTRLLQDSLGGKTKTVLVANISPSSLDTQATTSTLEYATKAKDIRNTAQIGPLVSDKVLLKELVDENHRLKLDLKATRTKEGVYLNEANYNELMINYRNLTNETEELKRQNEQLSTQARESSEDLNNERREKQKSIESMKLMESRLTQLENNLELQRSREHKLVSLTQKVVEHCHEESEQLVKSQSQNQLKLTEKIEQLVAPVIQQISSKSFTEPSVDFGGLGDLIFNELRKVRDEQTELGNRILEKTDELRAFRKELEAVFGGVKTQIGLLRSGINENYNNDSRFDKFLATVFQEPHIAKKAASESEKLVDEMRKQLQTQFSQFSKQLTEITVESVLNSTREKISAEQQKWALRNTTINSSLSDRHGELSSSFNECSSTVQSHLEASVGHLNYQRAKLSNINASVGTTVSNLEKQSEKQTQLASSYASLKQSHEGLESTMNHVKQSLTGLQGTIKPVQSQKPDPALQELQKLIDQPLRDAANRSEPNKSPLKRPALQSSPSKRRNIKGTDDGPEIDPLFGSDGEGWVGEIEDIDPWWSGFTIHKRWDCVATSLAMVRPSDDEDVTWKIGNESLPFSKPLEFKITEIKCKHDL